VVIEDLGTHSARASGHVSGASEAADAGEVDANRDRARLREVHGVAEARVDGPAEPHQPRSVVGHCQVADQDFDGAGEYDDAVAAVALEVERDQRLAPDVREPPGLRPVLVPLHSSDDMRSVNM
jgi:hypothetical protein